VYLASTVQNECRAEEHLEADQAAAAKDALDLCLYQVTHHLAKAIQKVVVVAGPEAYPSWSDFAAAFAERGGVIEACASGIHMPAHCFAQGTICCAVLYFRSNSLFLDVLCCAVLCCAVLCCAAALHFPLTVLCCAVLCCAVLCCAAALHFPLTALCCAVLCCAVLCCAMTYRCTASLITIQLWHMLQC